MVRATPQVTLAMGNNQSTNNPTYNMRETWIRIGLYFETVVKTAASLGFQQHIWGTCKRSRDMKYLGGDCEKSYAQKFGGKIQAALKFLLQS